MRLGAHDAGEAQARLGLLVEASARMARTLELRQVAGELAATVVPAFADRAQVDLVAPLLRPGTVEADESSLLVCRVSDVGGGAAAGVPGGEDDWHSYLPRGDAAQALEAGAARTVTGPDGSSVLLVPLAARGRRLGLVSFVRDASSPAYLPEDSAFGAELGARAALALDNVRLYDDARTTALALQRSLLPAAKPDITGVQTAYRYRAGSRDTEVGGDWFDVLPLSCGRVAFVIGDVMGRGLRAAAAMGQLRTAVRTLAVLDLMPDELLERLDHLAADTAEVQLATCVYAVFDPVTRELCFATAGHLPPALQTPGKGVELLPSPSGAPLGVGGVPFEASSVHVTDGSRLVLYTDGLVESREADIDTGLSRLVAVLAGGPHDLESLCDLVLEDMGRAHDHTDDVALLVARLHGLERERVATWDLAGHRSEIAESRSRVAAALEDWGVSHLSETAQLLVSELTTNAIRYGRQPIELQLLLLDRVVTFSVSDSNSPLPRFRRAGNLDEGGRGLQVVATLSARWGARATATGKVVWCELHRR